MCENQNWDEIWVLLFSLLTFLPHGFCHLFESLFFNQICMQSCSLLASVILWDKEGRARRQDIRHCPTATPAEGEKSEALAPVMPQPFIVTGRLSSAWTTLLWNCGTPWEGGKLSVHQRPRGRDSSRHHSLSGNLGFHRVTDWLGLEGTSGDHPVQPPAQAGSPTAGCTGPRPGRS